MGLVVLPFGASAPWSPDGELHADLRERVATAPEASEAVELTPDCHVVTLDRWKDGGGTWRLELGSEQALTMSHRDFCLDAFVADGELLTERGSWPRLGFRRFRAGTQVSIIAKSPTTVWLKARRLPVWRRRPIQVDGGAFGVSPLSGLDLCELSPAPDARVVLLRFPPGSSIGWHEHEQGEELVVVQGTLHDDQGVYRTGTWVRQPAGSGHEVRSPEGCLLYSHSGHLGPPS